MEQKDQRPPQSDGTPGYAIDDRWHFDSDSADDRWWENRCTGKKREKPSELIMHLKGIFDLLAKLAIGALFVSLCHLLVQHIGFEGWAQTAAFIVLTLIVGIKLKMEVKWL